MPSSTLGEGAQIKDLHRSCRCGLLTTALAPKEVAAADEYMFPQRVSDVCHRRRDLRRYGWPDAIPVEASAILLTAFPGGVIGNTTGSDPVVGGSNPPLGAPSGIV